MNGIIVGAAQCGFARNKSSHNKQCVFCTGADKEYVDLDGSTPLMDATFIGSIDTVTVLVDAGVMNYFHGNNYIIFYTVTALD